MPFCIDVFHGFYRTAIVPTSIDIVPFLINIVPTNNLFLNKLSPPPLIGEKSVEIPEKDGDKSEQPWNSEMIRSIPGLALW